MNLIISVEFLSPTYHGREWPPDPLRLYQALVRGSHEGTRRLRWSQDGLLSEAFRWLEQQACELIVAPSAKRETGRQHWVPNPTTNPDEKTNKTFRPYHMRDGQQIHYVWPLRDEEKYAQVIAKEASHMIALGWGIDQVISRGRVGDVGQLTGERWEMQRGRGYGELPHRHPVAGTMADLTARHKAKYRGYRPDEPLYPVPTLSKYRTIRYANTRIVARPYAAFAIGDRIPPHRASHVASMMRHLAIQNRSNFAEEFRDVRDVNTEVYLAGHVGKVQQTPPRFSYQVLPTIGPYGDGYIRRVLIAEQYGGNGRHVDWAKNVLSGQRLRSEKDGDEYTLEAIAKDGVVDPYVESGCIWRTVTPVVLRGWDDGNPRKLAKLLDRALEDAGIADVDRTWIQRAPFFPGGLHSAQYCRPRHLQNGLCLHVGVKFCKPVEGPLALGSGRHAGLGIMATARA